MLYTKISSVKCYLIWSIVFPKCPSTGTFMFRRVVLKIIIYLFIHMVLPLHFHHPLHPLVEIDGGKKTFARSILKK